MSRKELTELWISRVSDYRASGEPVTAWCERHQVSPRQLYYWMHKLRQADKQPAEASAPQWVAVSVAESTPAEVASIMVRIGTVAVEVRPGFEPAVLAGVVRTLKTLC